MSTMPSPPVLNPRSAPASLSRRRLFAGLGALAAGAAATLPATRLLGAENEDEVKMHPYLPKPWTSLRFPDGSIHDR